MITYRGFSTLLSKKKFSVSDYALVRQDLINHFNIKKGDKLMQPNFGTIIWDQLFEPLTDDTQQIITADIKRIVSYDPRLQVDEVAVTEQTNGLQISISLSFISTDQRETLALSFDRNSQTLTTN